MKITRADLSESTSGMEQLSAQFEIKIDEIKNMTLKKAIEIHEAMIMDMVGKQTHFIRERMSSEIPESQTVNAKGRKVDAQLVIDMLEKIQIDFYPDGTPHKIFVDSPLFTPEKMAEVDNELESNPELKKKFEEMMEKKRAEWRDREADRKLDG